jgi:hypothetical protein
MRVVVADDVMLTREGIIRLLTGAGVDVVDIRMPPLTPTKASSPPSRSASTIPASAC